MTFDPSPNEAFVWLWLPGRTDSVVAGRIALRDGLHVFKLCPILSGEGAYGEFNELTFMLNSGSDRTGALDFQASSKT